MQKLMMISALLIATGCTTVASTPAPVSKEPASKEVVGDKDESLRAARQAALLEALGG